jgi:RNA polymerase sigma factor (sigma-70 family)
MTRLSAGDQYLLDQIRQGSADGWDQLVERYQGRLVAFARSQLNQAAECDDLVQDVFLQFLQRLDAFREETSLETYLFMILRRRIIDHLRRKGRSALSACSLQEALGSGDRPAWSMDQLPDDQLSVSGQLIRQEIVGQQEAALRVTLEELVADLQRQLKFRDLQILELLFYSQLRNKDIAALMEMDEKQVALRKHRVIQRLAQRLEQDGQREPGPVDDAMLTRLWEQLRPSCPKRTTLGKFVLGTLDESWHSYVDFHLQRLGCRFCQANVADLQPPAARPATLDSLHQKILQSSVGFFRPR